MFYCVFSTIVCATLHQCTEGCGQYLDAKWLQTSTFPEVVSAKNGLWDNNQMWKHMLLNDVKYIVIFRDSKLLKKCFVHLLMLMGYKYTVHSHFKTAAYRLADIWIYCIKMWCSGIAIQEPVILFTEGWNSLEMLLRTVQNTKLHKPPKHF